MTNSLSSRGASSFGRATRDLLPKPSASDLSPAVPSAGLGVSAVVLALLAFTACSGGTEPTRRRLPEGWRLIQKQGYQALYAPSGRLNRVLNDSDGDGVAEAVVFYREDGRPRRSELDTNGDHVVDRWEVLRRDGTVSLSASSRRSRGHPDTWEYADAQGFVFQTEFDDDGDGEADRTEYAERPQAPNPVPETP